MSITQEKRPRRADLEQTIKREIVKRTGGRIRSLEVKVIDERIDVSGQVDSFYLKQLALQGLLEVIRTVGKVRLDLNIEVSGDPVRLQTDAG